MSCFARNLSSRSAIDPKPRCGPPDRTQRVGSPAVCESITSIWCGKCGFVIASVVDVRNLDTTPSSIVYVLGYTTPDDTGSNFTAITSPQQLVTLSCGRPPRRTTAVEGPAEIG